MANPQYLPGNEEDCWLNGEPASGLKTTMVENTGTEKYWVNGAPASDLFPRGNNDTGRFFIIFDG